MTDDDSDDRHAEAMIRGSSHVRGCPDCGMTRWHNRDCPALQRKQSRAARLALPLVIVIFVVDRLGGQSFGGTVLDFLVAGAACGAIGTWIFRRKG